MSHPDLFVVCKSCGSEVSPYVTECPYCGTRLRKRAPKIEREGGVPKAPRTPRRKLGRRREGVAPRLSRLRPNEIPGIRAERDPNARPYATIALVAAIVGVYIARVFVDEIDLVLLSLSGDPWRFVSAPFLNVNGWMQFAGVVGVGVFGWLLERRHGPVALIVLFALCGIGSVAAAEALLPDDDIYYGTQGAALGLLAAWSVPVLLGRRRHGMDDDADMIGVGVIAAVIALIPLAVGESMLIAGLGLAIGVLCGLLLAVLKPR
jgi:membrane associated rhomboid family serine protease